MSAVFTVYSEMSHALLVDEALNLRRSNAEMLAALDRIAITVCYIEEDAKSGEEIARLVGEIARAAIAAEVKP